ncbi:TyrR/PhhR family helix-turn-helix DNA-binding protein [Microbulbifer elongatus]|uniref:TyrR/PhhR family helix-turn-helix DNA-binding protein n=1 Tax=Microbulbifer elongatus TaxID=86173 RepID=UPI001E5B53EE|nr:TyrR/PhhR family helix-turn-helix DNA-binding protein [Microbulbifer elongatus]
MAVFTDFRVNVRSGEIGGDSGDKVYLSAPGLLATQFQSIEKALQGVPGVRRVRRIGLIPSERRHFELDTLLRHVSDPVLSVDGEGRIVAANLAAARAFGVSVEQVSGMQLQRFLPRLQLEELLRGLTAPRYGFPVTVRGRPFTLDWSPITLNDQPGAVASLAGAVLTLQQQPDVSPEAATDGRAGTLTQSPPPPQVLWDLDLRRDCCLQLQQLAPQNAPLMILGERGAGKTTFLHAAYYLSPLAERGRVYRGSGGKLAPADIALLLQVDAEAVVLLDDVDGASVDSQRLLADALLHRRFMPHIMLSATHWDALLPVLQQLFSTHQIRLPSLRGMRPAIPRFARLMTDQIAHSRGEQRDDLWTEDEAGHAVFRVLQTRDWPTNFTGLQAQLSGALAHLRARSGTQLCAQDFPALPDRVSPPARWTDWGRGLTLTEQMEKVERGILEELLETLPKGQRSSRTLARRLGISHTAVANKLRKYGLTAD